MRRIESLGNSYKNSEIVVKIKDAPLIFAGNFTADQLTIKLSWEGDYRNHLPQDVKRKLRSLQIEAWNKKTQHVNEALEDLKSLPPQDRAMKRKELIPFPGIVLIYQDFSLTDKGLVLKARVGNYSEIVLSNLDLLNNLPNQDINAIKNLSRIIGVTMILETNDGYHVFGQKTERLFAEGKIGPPGMTPNISKEQMKIFRTHAKNKGTKKEAEVHGSWLFKDITKELSDPEELNLPSSERVISSLNLLGGCFDSSSNCVFLNFYCKLNYSSREVQDYYSQVKIHEQKPIIFVKNTIPDLLYALSLQNMHSSVFSAYKAYFLANNLDSVALAKYDSRSIDLD